MSRASNSKDRRTESVAGRRVLLLATNIAGSDGIATVTRQAMNCWEEDDAPIQEVWSLLEGSEYSHGDESSANVRAASGDRTKFISWGLTRGMRSQRDTTVLAMHLALAPVALPLVFRGAKLAVFLYGVEAWRRVRRAEAAALRRAKLLIAISEHTARLFKEANPEFADRHVEVCLLGTEMPIGCRPPELTLSDRKHAYALIVGRMSAGERYKGHDQLIEVWPAVVNRSAGARLVIAGDGDDRPRLEAKAKASPAADQIQFVGRVSNEELTRLYRECAFFAMPSRGEGFGLVYLEAMRVGKACLGGIGAAAEVIVDGETGLIVDPVDHGALVDAIVRLFADSERTAQMGLAGFQRVANHFTAEHFRGRLRALISLLEGRS